MRRYLYMGVFFAGFTSLAVELSASRLLGNYFGSSNLVWAVIIGLILIYLSVGYTIGGRWADRSPNPGSFFKILLWAALGVGLIPLASRPILRMASQAFDQMQTPAMIGAFVSVLLLFSIPVTLLGTASPFAIRLALATRDEAGTIAGRIYTISTLGSFLGTFFPVLLLIPALGTYLTFVTISSIMMAVALLGLWQTVSLKAAMVNIWMPVLLAVCSLIGMRGLDKEARNIIYEGESAYNYIQVQEIEETRILRLNEGQGIHSIWHPTRDNFFGAWEQVLVAPFFNSQMTDLDDIQSMAILGLAAGTSARQAASVFPNIHIDGYEIDDVIIQIGEQYFDMRMPELTTYADDARWGITNNPKRYQVISVDAYRPPYIPWHLTTVEFFRETYDHLEEDGALVINIARIFDDRRLVDSLFATISAVYPSVYVTDIPDSFNTMVFATKSPTDFNNLIGNYIALSTKETTPPLLLTSMQITILNRQPDPEEGMILTDDHAPVEWITNQMILNFFVSGEAGKLQ